MSSKLQPLFEFIIFQVDNETMAAIGQGVVVEAPCVVLEVVAAEQVLGGHSKYPSCSFLKIKQILTIQINMRSNQFCEAI
jgi:hypothetical protein